MTPPLTQATPGTPPPVLKPIDRDQLAESIRSLPSFPAVVSELAALVHQPSANFDAIANTVGLDQALTARVLQLANSPFYGRSGQVASIRDGINILGLRQLNGLVAAATVTLQFERLHGKPLGMTEFWQHSIACAVTSRQLALSCGLDDAAAFTAGLLHDVGRLVLDNHCPEAMVEVKQWTEQHSVPLCAAERQLLGICHAEIGEWVSRHWRFTPDIIEAIANHHQPPPAGPTTLIDVVHAANAMVQGIETPGTVLQSDSPAIDALAWSRLRLGPESVQALQAQVAAECANLQTVLGRPQEPI